MPTMAEIQSYQMNHILFYIIFCRHSEFVTILIKEMLNNVKSYYSSYKDLQLCIERLKVLLDNGTIDNQTLIVIFFFFLTIDSKMRHWLLCTQQSNEDKTIRDNLIKKNITLIPNGTNSLSDKFSNPFLGQTVAFSPLHPKQAVSILLTLSQESFFQSMFVSGQNDVIHSLYKQIQRLVVNV
jgi:hypothetical protein